MANRRTRVDMTEALAGLDRLASAREPIARAMGVGMGQPVRDEAKARAPELKPGNEGFDGQQPGTLRDNIYLAFDDRAYALNPAVFRYVVSWNSFRAAHGHFMEFGFEQPYIVMQGEVGDLWYTPLTGAKGAKGRRVGIPRPGGPLRIAPQPFLGPAYDAKFNVLYSLAVAAGQAKFSEVVR